MIEVARGPFRRGLGMMFRKSWDGAEGLLLEHCNAIHTFFMRMSIDVIYLDREGRVLRTVEGMKPWRLGPIVWRAAAVLELPAGTLARTGTRPGDRVLL